MATIKLSGGKVVLKGGKVSCSCCAPPAECCLYPASGLTGGGYTADDLPETIIWADAPGGPRTYNKIPVETAQGLQAYYLAGGSAPIGSGDEDIVGIDESGEQWVRWSGGAIGGPGMCLINSAPADDIIGDDFQDEFPDTLTAQYGGYDPILIYRTDLCTYLGDGLTPESIPYTIQSKYGSSLEPYKWHGTAIIEGAEPDEGPKADPQSSPVGVYTTTTESTITVTE